jgi:hypothetical protein
LKTVGRREAARGLESHPRRCRARATSTLGVRVGSRREPRERGDGRHHFGFDGAGGCSSSGLDRARAGGRDGVRRRARPSSALGRLCGNDWGRHVQEHKRRSDLASEQPRTAARHARPLARLVPSDPSTLYLRAASPAILYSSTDSGASWSPLADIPTSISDFAVDPERASTLYGVGHEGLFRSTDGGARWTQVPGRAPPVASPSRPARSTSPNRAIVVDPTKPRVLYAALDAGGVYKGVDSGATWTRSSQGIAATSILGLALNRRRPSTLYAGGLHPGGRGGVWRSTDAGRSWIDVTAGMTTTWTAALALAPGGRTLYAGTTAYGRESGGGVFTRRAR